MRFVDRRIAWVGAVVWLGLGLWAYHIVGPDWILFVPLLFVPLGLLVFMRDPARTLRARSVIIGTFIVIVLGTCVAVQMMAREHISVNRFVHDGAVQTEDAGRFLTAGVDPYRADYQQSAFGVFIDTFSNGVRPNPAWTHYVYLPVQFLVGVPLSIFFRQVASWYDQRIVYILAQLVATWLLIRLARGNEWRLLLAIVFWLNPLWLKHFVFGFNDMLGFTFIIGALWAVRHQRWATTGILLGLASATKQSSWLFLPFIALYLWGCRRELAVSWRRLGWGFGVTMVLTLLPFVLWDPQAFYEDVWLYPTGVLATSYPISGVGFSPWLVRWGVVHDMWAYFPFWILQLAFGVPALALALWWQRRNNSLTRAVLASVGFGFVYWFFARYFNSNYVSYFSFFLIAALALNGPPRWLSGSAYGHTDHRPADL